MIEIQITSGFYAYRNKDCSLGLIKRLHIYSLYEECEGCGETLDSIYVHIIKKLRDADLLPDDYHMLCCNCTPRYLKKGIRRYREVMHCRECDDRIAGMALGGLCCRCGTK